MRLPGKIFFTAFVISACSDEDLKRVQDLEQYHVSYMLYPPGDLAPPTEYPHIVTIRYDDSRQPVKRTGEIITAHAFTGYQYQFTDKVFEDIVYGGERISIVKKNNLPERYISPSQREFFLNHERISRIIHFVGENPFSRIDTTDFFYNGAGLLSQTIEKRYQRSGTVFTFLSEITRTYSFEGGNLLKIEGEELFASGNSATTLELFEDYDTAPNPSGKLILFNETFYRSLSRNNFRKYTLERRNSTGRVVQSRNLSWTFRYNKQGIPIFL